MDLDNLGIKSYFHFMVTTYIVVICKINEQVFYDICSERSAKIYKKYTWKQHLFVTMVFTNSICLLVR
jgi:hypothetical protein